MRALTLLTPYVRNTLRTLAEEGTTDPANLLAPPTVPIESPLAAYQRTSARLDTLRITFSFTGLGVFMLGALGVLVCSW